MDESFANREMVVYVLYVLGGATKKCHTEDIAFKCFELWPSVFSWTKYPQYPDKEVVRFGLTDARKEKYGNLVDGRAGQTRGQSAKTGRQPTSDGWLLTDIGVKWIEENKSRFESAGNITKDHRQKSLQFLKKVRRHKVFALYDDSPERFYPSIGDLADLLRCRVDANEVIWKDRFERIRKHAVATSQEEFIGFVEKSMEAYQKQQ
jgi:hypothetical protein